jgi:nucleoid-associated protein YgaU
MALAHATIRLLDPARRVPSRFEVQFNPTEYTLAKGAQLAEIGIPGLDSPILQFVRGQNERLTMELFFDTTEHGMGQQAVDVTTLTDRIYQLVKMQPATHAPPRLEVTWGALSFKAVVESVQRRFTLFSPTGVPLRATLSVTFREYRTLQEQLDDLKLETADHTSSVTVARGEPLESIAARVYGDPREWRVIAEHNRVTDPRRLAPGTQLEVPPLPRGAATSGAVLR